MEESAKGKLSILRCQLQAVQLCIPLRAVEKVLPLTQLEPVPNSPIYLAGLMNLEGMSIPVIDLALCLGLTRHEPYSLDISILLCSNKEHRVGFITDKIIGLAEVDESQLQMHHELNQDNSPFSAVVTLETEICLLLNIDPLLTLSITKQPAPFKINLPLDKESS